MGSTELKDLLVGRCIPGKPVCPATTAEISLYEDIIRELTGFLCSEAITKRLYIDCIVRQFVKPFPSSPSLSHPLGSTTAIFISGHISSA